MTARARFRQAGGFTVAAAVTVVLMVGCGSPPPKSVTGKALPQFNAQLQAVREGRSDRIEAVEKFSPEDWASLRALPGLRVLLLQRGVASDAEAEILATLPDLERLVLRQSPLSDAGFAMLARCRSLEDVNVPQATCTAAGINSLAELPKLKSLRLGGANLTGPDVARALARLPALTSLHLIDVAIGDEGLDALTELATLRNLYLDGAGVSDAAWERYFEARPGVHAHVDQAHPDRDPRRGHD